MMVPPPHLAPPDYDEATKSCAPPDYETATKSNEFKFVPNTPEGRVAAANASPGPVVDSGSQQLTIDVEASAVSAISGAKSESSDA